MSRERGHDAVVTVQLHGALNDFLPPRERGAPLVVPLQGTPSVKDLLESVGPPHPELDVVQVDGHAVGFAHRVHPGSRVDAYPARHPFEEDPTVRVGPPLPDMPRFVLDVGLGRLAGFLRMLGFDTLWRNDFADAELARLSSTEERVVLSRDLGVLKRGEVVHGYFPRETDPAEQLVELVRRYALTSRMRPFSRCIACNAPLTTATPQEVVDRVPAGVTERHSRFQQCPDCRRVFWAGSHHQRMQALVDRLREHEHAR
ncbi:Mut7-C ubiquitin/RNAse domain-containing protein [Myxococcus sp. K15C18031901]|uniref:Mut7-C ubiquitin/RNAse domain-containing protein n=1 Tax=Myxococcus dinghuensis TaxID=2906761 RepID=UPI0020A7664F|nr:Mut7-C ubiquitin/RNAse domain-containing protein [Myxococcus dinghuensis]MCP3099032.1 Mut7-C ubiquitin/RNAse domain-containing protein [Myxococcus dinghuensis]